MNNFNIIRFAGDRKTAEMRLRTGQIVTVHRQERIPIEYYGDVLCASYQEHFVFENPDKNPGSVKFLCTCGAMAIIISPEIYARQLHDQSPSGYILCCQMHIETGKHAK